MPEIPAEAFLSDPSDDVLSAPAILIAGDEPYLVDKVLAVVLERVVRAPGADQFDLERRDAAELTAADLDAIVSTMPLVNDRRIVVLKDVPSIGAEARERVKAVLAEAPEGLCLIGTGGPTMRGNLYDVWAEAGVRIACTLRASPRSKRIDFDFARWLTARAKADFGVALDRDAAALLAGIGEELGPLYAELEKAALYVGEGGTITRADVEAVSSGGARGTVWEWCDAVGAGDARRAVELLDVLLAEGETAYRLIPLLATHFCRLGVVVRLGRRDPKSIMAALPGRSWHAMAKGLADQAARHTPASVDRALDRLADADRMLKSTGHAEDFVLHLHLAGIVRAA